LFKKHFFPKSNQTTWFVFIWCTAEPHWNLNLYCLIRVCWVNASRRVTPKTRKAAFKRYFCNKKTVHKLSFYTGKQLLFLRIARTNDTFQFKLSPHFQMVFHRVDFRGCPVHVIRNALKIFFNFKAKMPKIGSWTFLRPRIPRITLKPSSIPNTGLRYIECKMVVFVSTFSINNLFAKKRVFNGV
jgi:hypothetical protein